jgi:SAM-dependent methyltransferase
MKGLPRSCPLLERDAPSQPLAGAPAPWDLRRCSETGFVYLANPPAQERFRDEFAWEVTHEQEALRRQRREPILHALSGALKTFRHRFLKRDKTAAIIHRLLRDAATTETGPLRLVDVGCAKASLSVRVADRLPRAVADRLEPVGIEISNYLAKLAHLALRGRGGRCFHGTALDGLASILPGSAHVIVLSCILEHEIAALPLLRRCRERLARDGRIVVKVPNYACVGRFLRGPRWCGYRWPDHVNYFTPATLTAMARAAGLDVVRMNVFDASPLSDSLYAVLGHAPTAAGTVADRPAAVPVPLRRSA